MLAGKGEEKVKKADTGRKGRWGKNEKEGSKGNGNKMRGSGVKKGRKKKWQKTWGGKGKKEGEKTANGRREKVMSREKQLQQNNRK